MDTRENRNDPPPSVPSRPPGGREEGDGARSRTLADLLLRTPLFHRILLANAAVVALGAVAGTAVAVQVGRSWAGASTTLLAAGFAGVGLVLSVVVNGVLVRRLLDPLERLERAAGRIQAGADPAEEEVAVPRTTDPGLRRLVRVFNGMLRALAHHRTRLREMAVRCQEGAEDERDRISSVLQEDTAQRLASCVVRLRWARSLDGADRDRALDDLRGEMADVLESVRRLARSLRTPELDDIGLEGALRALARQARENWGTDVRLTLEDVDPWLRSEDRLTLYRGVEATLRSWAHEGRTDGTVDVILEREDGTVMAEIAEGPRGLPPAGDAAPGPVLFALRERARLSGGGIDLARAPDGPSRAVRIRLPVAGPDPLEPPDEARAQPTTVP